MLYSIKDREDLQNLEELVSLEYQVTILRLQNELGKQNFHEDMKKVFEPVTDTIENTSEKLTKTLTESSVKNNKALENLNNKLLQLFNDRGIIATYLMSPLSKITNPENTSQFNLVKDSSSNRVMMCYYTTQYQLENGTWRAQIPQKPLIFPSPNKQTNRQTKIFVHTEVRTLDPRGFSTMPLTTELWGRTNLITIIRLLLSD